MLVGILQRRSADPASAPPAPIAVTSSGPSFVSLDDLVDASDAVVIARARSVSAGRLFAAADGGLRSQIVELEVSAVLVGDDPGATIALEEEATTADGTPLIVDGLRPTAAGDQGIFFLVRSSDEDVPYFATVATSGRYLRASLEQGADGLLGTDGPLADATTRVGGRALTDAVVARGIATGRAGIGGRG